MDVEAIIADTASALTNLETALEPVRVQAEREEALRPFTAADGIWRFAPRSEREKAEQAIEAEQRQRHGELLFALSRAVNTHGPTLEGLEADAMRAPDPETAWTTRAGRGGVTASELISLNVLDELRVARYERELAQASPTTVLAQYMAALRDPSDQSSASLIRWVENAHGRGHKWPSGIGDDAIVQAQTASTLSKTIRETQAARVPARVTEARTLIAKAERARQKARDVHRVEMKRPA